jgi:hypothetical protein
MIAIGQKHFLTGQGLVRFPKVIMFCPNLDSDIHTGQLVNDIDFFLTFLLQANVANTKQYCRNTIHIHFKVQDVYL